MSLAQIGEFAFVLLSRASNLHLVEVCVSIVSFVFFFLCLNILIECVHLNSKKSL